jgi:hypothetical protein
MHQTTDHPLGTSPTALEYMKVGLSNTASAPQPSPGCGVRNLAARRANTSSQTGYGSAGSRDAHL